MDNISVIRNFMTNNMLKYLLINSTNEFLVEYNSLEENSRYKITKFSGSTGEALITPETIYLFVDGRYHIQADLEVNHSNITVVKLQPGSKYIDELISKIPENETIGIFAKKNSQQKYEYISTKRNVKLLDSDPLDINKSIQATQNIKLSTDLTGWSSEEKISKIAQNLSENEALYVTDLDEVSYLFNMRNYSQVFSAKIQGKCIIFKNNSILFTQDKLNHLPEFLKSIDKEVLVDKKKINAFDYSLLKQPKELKENPVSKMKAQKTDAELLHLKDAFYRTDKAVKAIRQYIEDNNYISEFDVAVQLAKEFKKNGALGLSFNSIVAKDKNSALAHYSKASKDEIISNGSLVLIDCGGYFEGGLATDITRVFVKGTPSELQKRVYTLVLKAFLNAFNYGKTHFNRPLEGFYIDDFIHNFFKTNPPPEGFVFNHGLGHGIGINVHEYPPNLSSNDIAKTPIKEGMCFSIEPGLYKEGFFGIRLENSCYYKDNQIHSFVNMNYENKLINYDMLTTQEKQWLEEFEVI